MNNPLLWTPDPAQVAVSNMQRFLSFVRTTHSLDHIIDYESLYKWSIYDIDVFWKTLLDFSGIIYEGNTTPCRTGTTMPNVQFFPELRLNIAENLLRFRDTRTALISISESRDRVEISYEQLQREVKMLQSPLADLRLQPGDRVAGLLPNIAEAPVAMLAASSLGGTWTSCSPDFGTQGILDRFGQVKPRVLFAVNGYTHRGQTISCMEKLEAIAEAIPEIEKVVVLPLIDEIPTDSEQFPDRFISWESFRSDDDGTQLEFVRCSWNHPLYIMYSSGTTGTPKCIVHGAGGTLLQHFKELALHCDVQREDNITYLTTCGWMMWNWLVSALFLGSRVTTFDGFPAHPTLNRVWDLIEDEGITHFGTSPRYLAACRRRMHPAESHDLTDLRVMMSTGAPLLPEDFDYVYDKVKPNVQLSSISGGTDIISCFMLGNPMTPVFSGELQTIGLGMDVIAADSNGDPAIGEKGELVCRQPFISMPVGFWDDDDGAKYREAYFDVTPGVWYHGDFVTHTRSVGQSGGMIVYGRSDATLKPGGVRIGTAEIYRIVESHPAVADSIVVGQSWRGDIRIVLFVILEDEHVWNDELIDDLRKEIAAHATAKHVPSVIRKVNKIPYTLSGKKVELAVRDLLHGEEPRNVEALADPTALDCYRNLNI